MVTNIESRRRSVFSWRNLARVGLTAAFGLWFYFIWNSTARLDQELTANADQFAAAHNLEVEYKNEIQEWKNLLLRSNNQASLDKNWDIYEKQYQKVAALAQDTLQHSDVRAINVKLSAFIEAHAANREEYRKSTEILARSGYDPHPADAAVMGKDRPLLDLLAAADTAMQDEKTNNSERLVAKTRSQIEQSLIALGLIILILIWRPRS
jgi:hypothetical protein